MKRIHSFSLLVYLFTFLLSFQTHAQIINDNKISAVNRPLWHNAGLLPTSRTLTPETPTTADNFFIIDANSATSIDDQIDNAITNATGTTIIFFPGGSYNITRTIDLLHNSNGSVNNSSIIFQGAGADVTFLNFDVGKNNNCFLIQGSLSSSSAWTSIDNNINKNNMSFNCSGMYFSAGNWIHILERSTSPYTFYNGGSFAIKDGINRDYVGQITQVTSNGYSPTIKDEAAKDYSADPLYNL